MGVMLIYVSQVTALLTSDAAGMREFVNHLVYPDNYATDYMLTSLMKLVHTREW